MIGKIFCFLPTITFHNLRNFTRTELPTIFVFSKKDDLVAFMKRRRHYAARLDYSIKEKSSTSFVFLCSRFVYKC